MLGDSRNLKPLQNVCLTWHSCFVSASMLSVAGPARDGNAPAQSQRHLRPLRQSDTMILRCFSIVAAVVLWKQANNERQTDTGLQGTLLDWMPTDNSAASTGS